MSKKILIHATYPNQPIGYSKIGCMIANFLSDNDYDVYYFGNGNYEGTNAERFIDPRIHLIDVKKEEEKIGSTELYGTDIIENFLEEIKPDIFFIYNDIIVVNRLFLALKDYEPLLSKKIKTYVYIDLVYPFERLDLVEHMDKFTDKFFVFSEIWKKNLIDMNVKEEKIKIMYHGFSQNQFHKMNKEISRQKMGIQKDDFVILNTNRNSYRKAQDICIGSFLRFYKQNNCDKRIKFLINCRLKSNYGYDILQLIKTECKILDLDYEKVIFNAIFSNNGNVSDETINLFYNACDIGVNTCVGEGFGLCNMEQAGLDIPQIVSCVGGLQDIFGEIEKDIPILIKPKARIYVSCAQDEHGGYLDICQSEDFVNVFQYHFENREESYKEGLRVGKYIRQKYDWKPIFEKFKYDLEN